MKILIFFLSSLLFGFNSFASEGNFIQISRAIWNGRDVTAEAAAFCNNKSSCTYQISPRYIGEATDKLNKSFSISWKCSQNNSKIFKLQEPHDAEGKYLNVSCNLAEGEPNFAKPAIPQVSSQEIWDPLAPLKYRSSFHSRMKQRQSLGIIVGSESPECYNAFDQHLASNKNFYLEYLVKNDTVRYEAHRLESVRNYQFFHWTKSYPALSEIATSSAFYRIFEYLRDQMGAFYFYVAADPSSSSYAGNSLFEIRIRKDTLIYNPQLVQNFELHFLNENPQFSQCNLITIRQLLLEGSGVSGISYFGLNNEMSSNLSKDTLFLQLIGEWAIDSIKFVKHQGR